MYRYQVGVRDLKNAGKLAQTIGINHALFRLDTTDFEFGPKGMDDKVRILRQTSYDWNYCGKKYTGTTNMSPKELKQKLEESGLWKKEKYVKENHNCHDFMLYCVNLVKEKKVKKTFFCTRDAHYNPFERYSFFCVGVWEAVHDLIHRKSSSDSEDDNNDINTTTVTTKQLTN